MWLVSLDSRSISTKRCAPPRSQSKTCSTRPVASSRRIKRPCAPPATDCTSVGAELSGSPNPGSSASSKRGGRSGSSSLPEKSVRRTGSGDGHAHGQYVGETATRSRCPAGMEYAITSSGTRTS